MIDELRAHCKELLAAERLDCIYGLGDDDGAHVPRFFATPDELDGLVLAGKQRLLFTCRPSDTNVVALVQGQRPGLRLGIVARGCDERALFELAKLSQLSLDGVEVIGVACDRIDRYVQGLRS